MDIKHRQIDSYLEDLLKINKVSDLKDLSIETKEKIFRNSINEFREGEICLDQLSGLSEKIWWSLSESEKKSKNNKFNDVLMSGMELDYYERVSDNEQRAKIFIGFLQNVLNY